MTPRGRDKLRALLAQHRAEWRGYPQLDGLAWVCSCGEHASAAYDEHESHVADRLVDAQAADLDAERERAEARLLAVGTSLDRVEERAHMSPYHGGPRSTLLDAIADVRAALADSGG